MAARGAATLLLTAALTPAWAGPHVSDLTVRVEDDRALVSFEIQDGLSEDALERIHSGIPVTFRYRVRLTRSRWLPLVPDREFSRAVLEVRATYDALTGRYALQRSLRFHARKGIDVPPQSQHEQSADSLEAARAWMTTVRELPLYLPPPQVDRSNLHVRVDSNLGRRWVWLVFPSSIGASAETGLEEP